MILPIDLCLIYFLFNFLSFFEITLIDLGYSWCQSHSTESNPLESSQFRVCRCEIKIEGRPNCQLAFMHINSSRKLAKKIFWMVILGRRKSDEFYTYSLVKWKKGKKVSLQMILLSEILENGELLNFKGKTSLFMFCWSECVSTFKFLSLNLDLHNCKKYESKSAHWVAESLIPMNTRIGRQMRMLLPFLAFLFSKSLDDLK
jgi:hypothetical protein